MSGFLITTILVREARETGGISLARFIGRRALRILPGLYLVALTKGLVALSFTGLRSRQETLHGVVAALTYRRLL
jgi:peptidoglycan/LPS O-acetylase OafA/YrhL